MINKTQIMLIALTLLIAGTGNLYAQDKQDAQAVASSDKKATLKASFPFINLQGAIILEVYINDYPKPLKLLFDTGADGMAIHEELAKELNLQITRTNKASVVGGFQDINVSDHNQVRIGDLKLQEMGIAIFPSKKAEGIDGLIGNTLLKRYITAIDYQSNIIRVYTPGNIEYPKEGNLLPIDDSTGLLRIPATLEIVPNQNHSGSFVFDTGASYNVICFRPFVRKNRLLVSGFKPDGQSSTVSFGIFSPTFYGRSASFKLKGKRLYLIFR